MKYIDVSKTPFKGNVKNVEIEQLSCVKNFLTVTNLKQTILFKNSNNQNRFVKQLQFLERICQHEKRLHELTQINFLKNQKRKMENWSQKTEKSCKDITFPELTITQLPSKGKSQKSLPSVCAPSGKHPFPENPTMKLTMTTRHASCFDETFLTRMNFCPESDFIRKQEKYLSSQEDLLSKKSVNDKRFCELESSLQTYSGNQVGQCSYVSSIVHFYKQKTGFNLCSSK